MAIMTRFDIYRKLINSRNTMQSILFGLVTMVTNRCRLSDLTDLGFESQTSHFVNEKVNHSIK